MRDKWDMLVTVGLLLGILSAAGVVIIVFYLLLIGGLTG